MRASEFNYTNEYIQKCPVPGFLRSIKIWLVHTKNCRGIIYEECYIEYRHHTLPYHRDNSRHGLSQWQTTLQYNVASHWLDNCYMFYLNSIEFWSANIIRNKWALIRQFMMTSSNGNNFRVTGLYAGNSPVTGEFPSQRPVPRSFDVLSDMLLKIRLSKHSLGWWFDTP